MDWIPLFCAISLVLIISVKGQQQKKQLRFCLPTLKGYLFENTVTQRCYQFVTAEEDRENWERAREYCQLNSGRLLNIKDNDKQFMIENFLSDPANTYKPETDYDPLDSTTWNGYDPDVWIGAMRDSIGTTWRFDQYATSRTVQSVILNWFNYGEDRDVVEQHAKPARLSTDACLFMRFHWKKGFPSIVQYPWYDHGSCTDPDGHKHPFICEYEGYEYLDATGTSKWLIVIIVLAVNVCCGFAACATYCLWEKIHTSYNVLQV
ncbi:uncharacterized protein [Watersipora subatra]|uniref:uncharacterized protein n=1 Tax=Watersipora subatra TaxID=2589382 RepID=UPI00355B8D7F